MDMIRNHTERFLSILEALITSGMSCYVICYNELLNPSCYCI